MPEVKISIGGRDYEVACQEGEEHFLQNAAARLAAEADVLGSQIGRIPEQRMLLMAGLMLADRTSGLDEQVRSLETRVRTLSREIDTLRNAPEPEPQTIEVPVVPDEVNEGLATLSERIEALARQVEEKAAG
ncbi:cell division protein ZapA [Profundibacterium mesophilum]|uniref:Cell division protein ZapA domain containing protein n=1 Tax=Profundibacterium mesophilum KAUST100406-0324 TaxID=1037889 RepID=A0A921TEQ4_9RHOB|nr:cell division protein ZapA [Profundibacterium mesophilum]KAF0675689.1 Cell division protein ZapA domain containing protein [Profundibacterium mesophilum KAUST100406-0324]